MICRCRLALAFAAVIGLLLCVGSAKAQYGGAIGGNGAGTEPNGPHGAFSTFEQMEQAGPDRKAKSDPDVIKEAKRKITDADPRVRVEGLERLRYVSDGAEANELLFRGLNDSDVRVRIKAIDVLGARGANDSVSPMAQDLFLRETPAIEKLHLVAALGRIGDSRGTLPIVEYLDQTDETSSRGTAVFALGEIGDPRASDSLIQIVRTDKSAMVRKLAEEAIEKIDGELPNRHSQELAEEKSKALQPTDEKLAKMRQNDYEMQAEKYGRSTR
jgi:HEAT repeat protein